MPFRRWAKRRLFRAAWRSTHRRLTGANMFLDEPSVTATENAVMAAAMARGETVIRNAACEPHVQDLCHLLNAMGARIRGIGNSTLAIEGVSSLGGAEYEIGADHIETGVVHRAGRPDPQPARHRGERPIEHLDSILIGFRRLGVDCRVEGRT